MKKAKENKVWLGKEGIVYAIVAKADTEKDTYEFLKEVRSALQSLEEKHKILIDITTDSIIHSSSFRKRVGDEIKDIAKNIGFDKVAIIGGNAMTRTITSFIIVASRQKNMKVFSDRKEALKWLKT